MDVIFMALFMELNIQSDSLSPFPELEQKYHSYAPP